MAALLQIRPQEAAWHAQFAQSHQRIDGACSSRDTADLKGRDRPKRFGSISWFTRCAVTAAVVLCALSVVAYVRFGSLALAVAVFQGEPIVLTPLTVEVEGKRGEVRRARFELTNTSAVPVTILGGNSDCACVVGDGLPLRLAAGESRALEVRVKLVGPKERFSHTVALYTDVPGKGVLRAFVAMKIADVPENGSGEVVVLKSNH